MRNIYFQALEGKTKARIPREEEMLLFYPVIQDSVSARMENSVSAIKSLRGLGWKGP